MRRGCVVAAGEAVGEAAATAMAGEGVSGAGDDALRAGAVVASGWPFDASAGRPGRFRAARAITSSRSERRTGLSRWLWKPSRRTRASLEFRSSVVSIGMIIAAPQAHPPVAMRSIFSIPGIWQSPKYEVKWPSEAQRLAQRRDRLLDRGRLRDRCAIVS